MITAHTTLAELQATLAAFALSAHVTNSDDHGYVIATVTDPDGEFGRATDTSISSALSSAFQLYVAKKGATL